jgi:hypothetical protein
LAVLEILKKNPEPTKAIIKSGVADVILTLAKAGHTSPKIKEHIKRFIGEKHLDAFMASKDDDPEKHTADIVAGRDLRALSVQVNELAKDPIQAEKEWERNQDRGR